MSGNDCIFCGMSSGAVETDFLYLDQQIMVIRDIRPKAPTHLMIIPRRHVKGLTYAAGRTSATLGQMFVIAEEMARREGQPLHVPSRDYQKVGGRLGSDVSNHHYLLVQIEKIRLHRAAQ